MDNFRVATYNVHKCVGLDRRRDPGRVAADHLPVVAEIGVNGTRLTGQGAREKTLQGRM